MLQTFVAHIEKVTDRGYAETGNKTQVIMGDTWQRDRSIGRSVLKSAA